ncbi:ABC transporter ATP-binding protein [Rhabdothermincola sediminis]|uniref:ABC transporter ATP-binding protein n=1 Tax=Rhabdothermincola sediminis TaxID=2751370 RepID=UPI001AA0A837|nr:nitrate/sulfonate/bicarbonate ABC transporter ATP-binding protein [Rhabdothermincola sediminis]
MTTISTRPVLVSATGITKSFTTPDGQPLPVLEGIDLEVREGEILALLGRSGSGKSTLLRCLAGLIGPTTGQVRYRGEPLTGANPGTAMVFQSFALLPWLTVQENVEIGLEARGLPPAERAERARAAIDLIGLDGFENAYPKELSGGMRQRVGFARALVVEPDVLLMDEPFSALDVLTAENLRGELLELWQRAEFPTKAIVLVTHNIEEAVLLADRVVILGSNPGRIRTSLDITYPRPRNRQDPDFEEMMDLIYVIMTGRHEDEAMKVRHEHPVGRITPGELPLPGATVDALSGLAEILHRLDDRIDLADLAEDLVLEVDDLLPLVDALELLGFVTVRAGEVRLTPEGVGFAGADIQQSKEIFARAALANAPLVAAITKGLENSLDGSLPIGFFRDVLRRSFSEAETDRQLDIALDWGRYAELYDYDAARRQLRLDEERLATRP